MTAPPHGRYKRALQGAGFTLEANTESVPNDGRYYVLREGKELLATEDFQEGVRAVAERHQTGEQGRPGGHAGRRGGEGMAEQQSLAGKLIKIRRADIPGAIRAGVGA